MYCEKEFPTKKALKTAIAEGEKLRIYQPGPFGKGLLRNEGKYTICGPHFPKAHKWYAVVHLDEQGYIKTVA